MISTTMIQRTMSAMKLGHRRVGLDLVWNDRSSEVAEPWLFSSPLAASRSPFDCASNGVDSEASRPVVSSCFDLIDSGREVARWVEAPEEPPLSADMVMSEELFLLMSSDRMIHALCHAFKNAKMNVVQSNMAKV